MIFFHCTIIYFEQFAPYTVIRHYTIIKFDRFATLYCYLAYTFIRHSRVERAEMQRKEGEPQKEGGKHTARKEGDPQQGHPVNKE